LKSGFDTPFLPGFFQSSPGNIQSWFLIPCFRGIEEEIFRGKAHNTSMLLYLEVYDFKVLPSKNNSIKPIL
jgi:hypothetical protein